MNIANVSSLNVITNDEFYLWWMGIQAELTGKNYNRTEEQYCWRIDNCQSTGFDNTCSSWQPAPLEKDVITAKGAWDKHQARYVGKFITKKLSVLKSLLNIKLGKEELMGTRFQRCKSIPRTANDERRGKWVNGNCKSDLFFFTSSRIHSSYSRLQCHLPGWNRMKQAGITFASPLWRIKKYISVNVQVLKAKK